MKALIIGATGATGKDLLNILLEDDDIHEAHIFVRRGMPKRDKLTTHLIDFDQTEEWRHLVQGGVLFSCLGTTVKAAGSKEQQWKVDYGYQYEFAKAARDNGVENYVLVSAANASSKSPIFYSRMKGQLEEAIKKLEFRKTIILKPPLLDRKGSKRGTEVWGVKIISFLNSLGVLKSQSPLSTKVLAEAMVNAFKQGKEGIQYIKQQEIRDWLK
ncbi:NAD(P)H-binding protein [Ulvibacterium sp.]|uniref:NAD(P)H-binding protein n=1 Tax=Ulvibacterium sp. TaxID=2665914 RepID=UPI0026289E56|nr:NAD(P)H-binding protein [Ulvibacterium sp.]